MFFRLLWESFVRQRRRKALAATAILLGTTAVTAMLALATTIGDRIHRELAVYGANIVIYPKADTLSVNIAGVDLKPATGGAYLHVSDLEKLKTIFWANNITGVSPELSLSLSMDTSSMDARANHASIDTFGRGFWFNQSFAQATTGATQLHPLWKVEGTWPHALRADQPCAEVCPVGEVVVGRAMSQRLNLHVDSRVTLKSSSGRGGLYSVVGIASTDSDLDSGLVFALSEAQRLANLPDAISRVEIAARTKPEDAFARKDPDTLSPAQHEVWYCRPYANSIAYQIREAIPGAAAEQVRQIEQSEGTILSRISGLMWLISGAALLAAGFAVSAAVATAVLERRHEIALMRSLGASRGSIALLFYSETGLLALAAGTGGYLAGSMLASWLGGRIFVGDSAGPILNPVLLPVVVATAFIVAIAGSMPSIRSALRMEPSMALRADA